MYLVRNTHTHTHTFWLRAKLLFNNDRNTGQVHEVIILQIRIYFILLCGGKNQMTHLNQDFATGYEKIGLWTGLKRETDWKKDDS